jgi:hypothetical protein
MNTALTHVPPAALSHQAFAVGIQKGISGGRLKSVWQSVTEVPKNDIWLCQAVAQFSLSNAELLALTKLEQLKAPQSWFDEDHEGLY